VKSNRQTLDGLFAHGKIDLRLGAWFNTSPGLMPVGFDFDKIEGMMLGLAIGDSLGNTTEGMLPGARRERLGEIRDYLPNNRESGKAVGLPSDDTQLAFWTLEQMILDRGFNPEHVARRFCSGRIFGIGRTVREFIANYQSGKPGTSAGLNLPGTEPLCASARCSYRISRHPALISGSTPRSRR
jgi:hypothetical protein